MPTKSKRSKVERLEEAGVLDSATLRPSQKKKIEELSEAEVKHLISSRQTVGNYSRKAHPKGRPWIL
jgi:hypothetical protein